MSTLRKIIHVDMDAFYAAVEQRDDPRLRGRPLAVGSPNARGVVLTASYEARAYGVRSAMPSAKARQLCPDLIFVPPRFDAYKETSGRIRRIFECYTPLVEPLSLDEAYLDVTEALIGPTPAIRLARMIKREILLQTELTASAGVSFNKFLAKIASDLEKPDGLSVILPEAALSFIAALPIERFHGVGPATASRMHGLGIRTGSDLQARSKEELMAIFGRGGYHYWKVAHALDDRPVDPLRPRRSLSVEDTFERDVSDISHLVSFLRELSTKLADRITRAQFLGRTLTMKIKFADFTIRTRSRTLPEPLFDPDGLWQAGRELLLAPPGINAPVRLLGLGVANPVDGGRQQLELFPEPPRAL